MLRVRLSTRAAEGPPAGQDRVDRLARRGMHACGAFHACRIVDADRRRIGNEPREHEHPDPAFAYAISAILDLRDRTFDIVFA